MINNQTILTDISFYQDDDNTAYKVDFKAMKAGGVDGSILRAGQNLWIDEDFRDYVRNAILAFFPWGAYWFYDSRVPPEAQAAKLQEALSGLPKPPLGIWADYEDTYGGAWGGGAHFRIFMQELKNRFPNTLLGIYTAPYYWINNTKPEQRDWFKQFPLWIAHYGVNTPTIPYPWTKYTLWQYTNKGDGKKFGVESFGLDMDLFNGTFDDFKNFFRLELSQDITIHPFTGIAYSKVRRFNNDCYITVIDLLDKKIQVTNTNGLLEKVSRIAEKFKAQIVINGDGWLFDPIRPISIASSNGNLYQPVQYDFRYWMNVSKENNISFNWKDTSNLYNAVSGTS